MAAGWIALCASALTVQAAVVYKWTDADGVVHFSDQPVPGAERIVTASGSLHGGLSAPGGSNGAPAKPKSGPASPTITQFSIVSPGHEQMITGNQPVNVRLDLEPTLTPAQAISWYLNGAPVSQPPDSVQFTLTDLTRGTYILTATILDRDTGETKSADPVTFYVAQPSLLSPQHKSP
jgi:hypothetical protein